MIVNVYALLAGSLALLQLILGGVLATLGGSVWLRWRASTGYEQKAALEDRTYLLFLQACFLAGLNVASWPLLYLVLQSYVPEWPGVICIYGVMRIGIGSVGASGYLPRLLDLLQVLKPALVFLTGAWWVLYSVHRRSQTAWLLRSILAVLVFVGIVSSLDASAEIAYLLIPKKNHTLYSGCCPVSDPFLNAITDHKEDPTRSRQAWLGFAYFAANLGVLGGLGYYRRRASHPRRFRAFVPLLALAAVNFGISIAFLTEVVSPAVLKQPTRYCVYDLVQHAPHVGLAVVLLAWGSLSVGWVVLAGRLAGPPETSEFLGDIMGGIARRGQYAYLFSMVLIACTLLGVKASTPPRTSHVACSRVTEDSPHQAG